MKQKLLLLAASLLVAALPIIGSAQNYLRVYNPQASWRTAPANIDEAIFTLAPHGAYTEVGMYLTFSAKGAESLFTPDLPLEVRFDFQLPREAMVTDSWLWVDDQIIQAKILDRWTASQIYESIVNRRRDPSILFKEGSGRYRLQIYPLPMGKSRKVKLTFLVPNSWSENEVKMAIPESLVSLSRNVPDLQLRVFPSAEWTNPRVYTHPDVPFRDFSTPELGSFKAATIPRNYLSTNKQLEIAFDAPWKEGVYLSRYGSGSEGYYQLGVLPFRVLGAAQILPPQRVLVLLHYNPEKVLGITLQTYLQTIRDQLIKKVRPGDFINVMVASLSPSPVAPTWVAATESNIQHLFQQAESSAISSSNLPTLIGKGISWIGEQKTGGKMLLFANSSAEGDPTVANPLLNELSALDHSASTPCFIADFQNINATSYYIGGTNYRGNEYFYYNLSRQTKGDYLLMTSCCGQSDLPRLAERILDLLYIEKAQVDFHTSLKQGFCFNRYPLLSESTEESLDLTKPIFQIGRYQGQWPFLVELSGSLHQNLFFNGIAMDESVLSPSDSTLKTLWHGYYIRHLEENAPNNRTTGEIIGLSLKERILSRYTAFLCLEPSLGGEPCPTCTDQSKGEVTSIPNRSLDSLLQVTFSPNPFSEQTIIRFAFRKGLDLASFRISICNALGQEVKTFTGLPAGKIHDLSLTWDGSASSGQQVPSGMYFLTLQGPEGKAAYPVAFERR
ncbi:MAG: hypothetical protein KBC60_00020 [Haliscomenobacter sp.]|nr:hypothetical protein [Haliscomenobacter sp.]